MFHIVVFVFHIYDICTVNKGEQNTANPDRQNTPDNVRRERDIN